MTTRKKLSERLETTEGNIRERFKYHSPNPRNVAVHETIRENMTETVIRVAGYLPDSPEREQFVLLMQQAQMMANAAVAIYRSDVYCACGSNTCVWCGSTSAG